MGLLAPGVAGHRDLWFEGRPLEEGHDSSGPGSRNIVCTALAQQPWAEGRSRPVVPLNS